MKDANKHNSVSFQRNKNTLWPEIETTHHQTTRNIENVILYWTTFASVRNNLLYMPTFFLEGPNI